LIPLEDLQLPGGEIDFLHAPFVPGSWHKSDSHPPARSRAQPGTARKADCHLGTLYWLNTLPDREIAEKGATKTYVWRHDVN
jgi:hypothetical protein